MLFASKSNPSDSTGGHSGQKAGAATLRHQAAHKHVYAVNVDHVSQEDHHNDGSADVSISLDVDGTSSSSDNPLQVVTSLTATTPLIGSSGSISRPRPRPEVPVELRPITAATTIEAFEEDVAGETDESRC